MSEFYGRSEAEGLLGEQHGHRGPRTQGPPPRGAVDDALADLDGKIGELHARIEALRNSAAPAATPEPQVPPLNQGYAPPREDPPTAYEQAPQAPTGTYPPAAYEPPAAVAAGYGGPAAAGYAAAPAANYGAAPAYGAQAPAYAQPSDPAPAAPPVPAAPPAAQPSDLGRISDRLRGIADALIESAGELSSAAPAANNSNQNAGHDQAAPPSPVAEPAPVQAPVAPPAPAPAAVPANTARIDIGPFGDLVALRTFEQGLAGVPGVGDVYVQSFSAGRAHVEVTLSHPISIVDELHRGLGLEFDVEPSADPSLVTLHLRVPEAPPPAPPAGGTV
jgi:hypothetical protein